MVVYSCWVPTARVRCCNATLRRFTIPLVESGSVSHHARVPHWGSYTSSRARAGLGPTTRLESATVPPPLHLNIWCSCSTFKAHHRTSDVASSTTPCRKRWLATCPSAPPHKPCRAPVRSCSPAPLVGHRQPQLLRRKRLAFLEELDLDAGRNRSSQPGGSSP